VATWRELSLDSLRAARVLLAAGHVRSSISRSYYAAYCAVSGELARRRVRFARGWQNPSHEQLAALIQSGLPLPVGTRRQLSRAIRRLRVARETADYRPGVTVHRGDALAATHDAGLILEALEIADE